MDESFGWFFLFIQAAVKVKLEKLSSSVSFDQFAEIWVDTANNIFPADNQQALIGMKQNILTDLKGEKSAYMNIIDMDFIRDKENELILPKIQPTKERIN